MTPLIFYTRRDVIDYVVDVLGKPRRHQDREVNSILRRAQDAGLKYGDDWSEVFPTLGMTQQRWMKILEQSACQ